MDIEIWTDGSCHNKGGGVLSPMGLGIVILAYEKKDPTNGGFDYLYMAEYYVGLGEGTSNRAELLAMISGLLVLGRVDSKVTIYSDSRYAIGQARGDFKINRNEDIVLRLRELVSRFPNVEFKHVSGHSGIHYNERADQLADSARRYAVEVTMAPPFYVLYARDSKVTPAVIQPDFERSIP
jgi:ribonuclease HI